MDTKQYFARGGELFSRGKYSEALAEYERCVAGGAATPKIHFNRAEVLLALNNREGAIEAYELFVRSAADDGSAQLARARQRIRTLQHQAGRCGKDHFFLQPSTGLIFDDEPRRADARDETLKLPIVLLPEVEEAIDRARFTHMGTIWKTEFSKRMEAADLKRAAK